MYRKQLKMIVYALFGLAFIHAFQLIFVDSALLKAVLKWLLFSFSILLVIDFIYIHKAWIQKNFSNYKDKWIVVFAILLMDISFLVKNSLHFSMIYLFSMLFGLSLLILFSMLLPRKISRIFDIIMIGLYAIYCLGQDTYYRIFRDFFSFREAVTLREGIESGEGMYRFEVLQVVVLLIVFVSLFFYTRNKVTSHIDIKSKQVLNALLFPGLLFILIQFNANYQVSSDRPHTSDHYLYSTLFNRTQFATRFGTFNLLVSDLSDTLTPRFNHPKDQAYLDSYFENNHKNHQNNEYTDIFLGKNLIFILAESYDELALSEELTPNLYKLKTEGIDFQNHFTPVFQRTTSDTEFIFNTSLVPSIEDGPTSFMFHNNSYSTSLANLFKKAGYQANAMHANYKEFYTRHISYEGLGYEHFYGRDELGLNDDNKKFDSIFYSYAKDYILPEVSPFFSFVITYSGHSPYTEKHAVAHKHLEQIESHYGDTISDSIKYYLATQLEIDEMLGMLLSDLEDKGILDDTVILLSGDHYPYTMRQDDYEAYTGIREYHLKHKGNLYIWNHNLISRDITMLSTSFDILPMINNMFGLGGNYNHYVGNDIFGTSGNFVMYKNYAVYDGSNYMMLSDSKIDGNGMMVQATLYYQLSKKILRTNYFKVNE
ncbi:MAG: sulfatase-like hydrolase/transferase [Firmicutes bacterium]|nr:sulfatase-like hydrolase/transferase [Bacillota bacterium]